jgi:hypothetical protein
VARLSLYEADDDLQRRRHSVLACDELNGVVFPVRPLHSRDERRLDLVVVRFAHRVYQLGAVEEDREGVVTGDWVIPSGLPPGVGVAKEHGEETLDVRVHGCAAELDESAPIRNNPQRRSSLSQGGDELLTISTTSSRSRAKPSADCGPHS